MPDPTCTNTLLACDRPVYAKGLCRRCYERKRLGIPMGQKPERRKGAPFMDSVEKDPKTGCWNWTASDDGHGYGMITAGGRVDKAHRVSYRMHVGPIPDGLYVCHRCDSPPCVNPDHLFLGTHADNLADMAAKGRSPRGVGHHSAKLTEDDVRAIRADTRTQREIAEEYGVDPSIISDVKHRKSWKHVL